LSHQPFLLLTTCLTARLGFNKLNGLASRQGAAREPLLAGCDNAARTKNKRPHVVPLPPMARELIESVFDIGSDFVFTTTGASPVTGWTRIKRRLDARMGCAPWRLHDLRRTCATGMAEIGIAPHIVEAVLNHVSGAKASVAGVYNRATYAAEKKAALERWSAHVASVVGLVEDRGVVIPMRA
jgi:integrase